MDTKYRLTHRVSAVCTGISLGALVIISLIGATHAVRAQNVPSERVVYNFVPSTGYEPTGVIRDPAGNLYVATDYGGSTGCTYSHGCGTILKVSPTGQATVLYTFGPASRTAGQTPRGLVRDEEGNLYGTTDIGGRFGSGTVFKLTPSGVEGILHTFDPSAGDGENPDGDLAMDSAGNLYGTTFLGGGTTDCDGGGCGTIYRVTHSGIETVLYSFTGGTDGNFPDAGPILDAAGNLYGTAGGGGDLSCPLGSGKGCGTVWKLDTSGNLTVLYSFTGGEDGANPYSGLVMDSAGNLYGPAEYGGNLTCYVGNGCGVVFEISSSGNFTVLHTFTGGSNDGQNPYGTLLRDTAGNLYGTTFGGGDQSCTLFGTSGCGVVFKVDSSGDETILHAFTGGTTDGAAPGSALISDGKGTLYGTTEYGGLANGGVIFAVRMQ